MISERGEPVATAAFIAAAERYRSIATIDRWVVRESLARLGSSAPTAPTFSVNLSGQSLGDEAFLEHVLAEIDSAKVDPRRICFEITETAAIANLSAALRFMSALRGLGCRFILDDFGSGFSSFAYLKNLPVDFLKIDGQFMHNVAHDRIDRGLVEAIAQIGQTMGIRTIAERVDSAEVLDRLADIGIQYAQGHYIAAPQTVDNLETLIAHEPGVVRRTA
jgi:EAL domain-containing protein (putative c-di-GMP-specific phosphodiesterase class I)